MWMPTSYMEEEKLNKEKKQTNKQTKALETCPESFIMKLAFQGTIALFPFCPHK